MKKILLLCLILTSPSVMAFSDLGHKMIAAAAWEHLTPYAKQNIERILGVGKTEFIEASVWADKIKSNEDFNYLKPLHYVNLPKAATTYVASRDCKSDKCVVEGIHTFSKIAKNGSENEKVLALKMLIHLIGDIHQPLHAGLYEDRGGNWFEVKYEDKHLTLHKFWDNQAVKRFANDVQVGAKKLVAIDTNIAVLTPKQWAEESHRITVNSVYQTKENSLLSDEYLAMTDTIIESQLQKAAWRLAIWLNKLW